MLQGAGVRFPTYAKVQSWGAPWQTDGKLWSYSHNAGWFKCLESTTWGWMSYDWLWMWTLIELEVRGLWNAVGAHVWHWHLTSHVLTDQSDWQNTYPHAIACNYHCNSCCNTSIFHQASAWFQWVLPHDDLDLERLAISLGFALNF